MMPDEAAVAADLGSFWFRKGEHAGKWRLIGHHHPELFIAVAAAPRPASPEWFLFRLDVMGFRVMGPTGQLWHGGEDRPYMTDERPKSGPNPMIYFSEFGPCLYHPLDRLAFAGGHWANEYLDVRWQPTDHLTRYLETLHGLLHDSEYTGSRILDGTISLPPRLVARAAA
jgi:hypothetical protein